jgi:hypothetical protein
MDPRSAAKALGGEVVGGQVSAPGPGHSPHDRSLSVKMSVNAPDGFIVHSHAGDDWKECRDHVYERLGKPKEARAPEKTTVYDYHDEDGNVLFQVVRFVPKSFRQRRPDGNGDYIWNMDGVRRVPYHLPEVLQAIADDRPIFIAEGEKDVDALMQLGVIATCNSGGAKKWSDKHSELLRGADAIIIPDADEAGEEHLEVVTKSLTGIAKRVRTLRLPGAKDPFDWIASSGTREKLRELFRELVEEEQPAPISIGLIDWLERDIPPVDLICASFIHTTCRILFTAPTGLGRTMLGLAMAIRNAAGEDFLHWKAVRPARVLYVDGEMPRAEMQRRLRGEVARSGLRPDNLFILSREDFEDMPPLNTEEGQSWMNGKIELFKPELIYLDNIQALLSGEHAKEESWQPVLPWMWSLTRRHIGQFWFHHTGHNEGHAFGTSTRSWQMDTTALLERVQDQEGLIFTIKFDKKRCRTPETAEDYRDVTVALEDDRWAIRTAPNAATNLPAKQKLIYEALVSLAAERGERLPPSWGLPSGLSSVSVESFKAELKSRGLLQGDYPWARYGEFTDKLKVRKLIAEKDGRIWPSSNHEP